MLPFPRRATASALLGYTHHFEGFVDEAGASLRGVYQSSRFADPAGPQRIPRQTTVDLEALVRLVEQRVTARGRIANLFDAERFDVVGFPLPLRLGFSSLDGTFVRRIKAAAAASISSVLGVVVLQRRSLRRRRRRR